MKTRVLRLENGARKGQVITAQGSKNVFLHIAAVALLADATTTIELTGSPSIQDREVVASLLREAGVSVINYGDRFNATGAKILSSKIDPKHGRRIRPTACYGAAIAARTGRCVFPYPGGDSFTHRPIETHIRLLQAAGGEVRTFGASSSYISVEFPKKVRGFRASAATRFGPSLGATVTGLLVGTVADGVTTMTDASIEPEVICVAEILRMVGAEIDIWYDERIIEIVGTGGPLAGQHARFPLPPDRMEAGTYLMSGLLISGHSELHGISMTDFPSPFWEILERVGVSTVEQGNVLVTSVNSCLAGNLDVQTGPHPGFPTDLQPQLAAFLTQAQGSSVVQENVYDKRLSHVAELAKIGLRIDVDGTRQTVCGPQRPYGGRTCPRDIRASAAVLVGASANREWTELVDYGHLRRGYSDIVKKLHQIGFEVEVTYI